MSGRVVLVGAGPGDPDLLTVRAVRELESADVVLYDALIDPAVLELLPESAERIDVGKRGDGTRGVDQAEIAALMIARARDGRRVVRLKGGDPFVFGRGGEEASALREAGVPFEVVPGISSIVAVPAYAGIPITDRRASSSVAVITGHRGGREPVDGRVDWEGLAGSAETLVILMATAWIEDITARVIAGGRAPETPAAVIARGTTPEQRVVRAPLGELAARVREAGLEAPTTIVIGEVARLRDTLAWYERRPLFGRRVLVARAADQRGELGVELARRGARAVPVALLEFEPAEPRELRRALAGEYDWLVFSSRNAVRFAAPHLPHASGTRPRVACIGAATAQAARAAGLAVDLLPLERSLPETLVEALVATGTMCGARVLVPRAERAREALVESLRDAGARVEAVTAYRTRCPAGAGEALAAALRDGVDAVALTSPSTVEHLFGLLEGDVARDLAQNAVFACIGPTTRAALAAHGVARSALAAHPTMQALADALEGVFAEEQHGLS